MQFSFGFFSATPHASYVLFKNVYEIGLIILLKKQIWIWLYIGRDIADIHDAQFATSRTGHDNIL